ncbi:MAG: Bug family tripartite tricarboxylate transporter substrate binding protein [Beijerinckiaceae bacterium]
MFTSVIAPSTKYARKARLALSASSAALLAITLLPSVAVAQAWEPVKPVEFLIPAGAGGGADQMARFIQGVITKNKLMKQPMVVVNKSGGAGAEAFLDIKVSNRDPHKLVITLSNLFTTPLGTNIPFSWKEITPISMLALDQFILWVNAESEIKTPAEFIAAVKAGDDRKIKMGGTGSKQEDQIITVAIERLAAPKKITYIPYRGGGEVAVQLVGKHVDSTVNNPIEAVSQWRGNALRALCIFDSKRSTYTSKVTATMAWSDIPTCKEAGMNVEYQMLRGVFAAPGITPAQAAYYVDLFKRVSETADWKEFMEQGAFNQTQMSGDAFKAWLTAAEKTHYDLMKEAGFLAPGK